MIQICAAVDDVEVVEKPERIREKFFIKHKKRKKRVFSFFEDSELREMVDFAHFLYSKYYVENSTVV
jgi:hypothetical protein